MSITFSNLHCNTSLLSLLPNELIVRILSFIDRIESINIMCVCKEWNEIYLTHVFPPWKIFHIYDDGTEFCGLYGAFDINQNTVNIEYFYKWYYMATNMANDRFDLNNHGSYLFRLAIELNNEDQRKELSKFFLDERSRRNQLFDISEGVEDILFNEYIDLAYMIFIDYCQIPISKKVLKKWCTILIYRRPMPEDKVGKENRIKLVAWIKNRPEMTKFRIKGIDRFAY